MFSYLFLLIDSYTISWPTKSLVSNYFVYKLSTSLNLKLYKNDASIKKKNVDIILWRNVFMYR